MVLGGTALNWFTSYLPERQQYVSANGNTSDQLEISCGVPQGSSPWALVVFDLH